jgi:hypothetical protein
MNPFLNLSRLRLRALLDPCAKIKDTRQSLESPLRDDLVGAAEQRERDGNALRLGDLEIDDELSRGLRTGRLPAMSNLVLPPV